MVAKAEAKAVVKAEARADLRACRAGSQRLLLTFRISSLWQKRVSIEADGATIDGYTGKAASTPPARSIATDEGEDRREGGREACRPIQKKGVPSCHYTIPCSRARRKSWFEPYFVLEYQTFPEYSHTQAGKAAACRQSLEGRRESLGRAAEKKRSYSRVKR